MKLSAMLFGAALLANEAQSKQDICRALVLSGGGNNGAWEMGVLHGMVNAGNPADFTYDVLSGISAGSVNVGGMAGWELGQEVEMAQWMSDMWRGLTTKDVWQEWPLGIISGAWLMPSLLDDAPFYVFLQSAIYKFSDYARRVTITATNVETGEYTEFDQTNTPFRDVAQAALCSASLPVIFTPHKFHDRGTFMDGGTAYNVNIEAAVRQCRELVEDNSQIIMDMFICDAPDFPEAQEAIKSIHSYEQFHYSRQLHKYYNGIDSTVQMMRAIPDVQYRYIVGQHVGAMSGLGEIKFDDEFTWPLQQQGRLDGQNALKGTNAVNIKDFLLEWADGESALKKEFTTAGDFIKHRAATVRQAELEAARSNEE